MQRLSIQDMVHHPVAKDAATRPENGFGKPASDNGAVGKAAGPIESIPIIPDTGYAADVLPPHPIQQRTYRLQFMLPRRQNAFMICLTEEVKTLAERLAPQGIQIALQPIDAFDSHAVSGTLAILDKTTCDGVAIAAPASREARAAIDRLALRGVPVVTLVSDHPNTNRASYVGLDNVAAGRVAARLMGRFLPRGEAKIGFLAGSFGFLDHAERYSGCLDVMEKDFPQLQIQCMREGRDDNSRSYDIVARLLSQTPDLAGLYNIGAGNRGVIAALQDSGVSDGLVVIAHELTHYTREALQSGLIDAIIAQDPAREARVAIKTMLSLCNGRKPDPKDTRIGIDIFLKDNAPKRIHSG